MIEMSLGVGDGLQAFRRQIGLMKDVVDSWRPIWTDVVHPWLLEHMRKQFETEGRHGGKPWAGYQNEPIYAEYRARLIGDVKILSWEKGNMRLRPSFTDKSHPEHYFRATDRAVTIGSSVPYANDLNQGGVGPFDERYPPRIIMAMKKRQKKRLVTKIQRKVQEIAGKDALRGGRQVV
ncbi:MAG: hypothetical protein ABEN55_16255 [Bradymonadaceae bacterium]